MFFTVDAFCLLLWNELIDKKVKTNIILYRGANLQPEWIAVYEEMAKHEDKYASVQAFSSCSCNLKKAKNFENTLFIMKVPFAFTSYLHKWSKYPAEEKELVALNVCFSVRRVKFNRKKNKCWI